MAFNPRALDDTTSGGPGGPKLALYDAGADNLAAVAGAGYFNDAATQLNTGDVLIVVASDGTKFHKVTSAAGVVTLSAGLVIT